MFNIDKYNSPSKLIIFFFHIHFSFFLYKNKPYKTGLSRLWEPGFLQRKKNFIALTINPSYAKIFTVFGRLLESRMLHKGSWVAKLLGTHLSIQVHKKVKLLRRDNWQIICHWQLKVQRKGIACLLFHSEKDQIRLVKGSKILKDPVLICS